MLSEDEANEVMIYIEYLHYGEQLEHGGDYLTLKHLYELHRLRDTRIHNALLDYFQPSLDDPCEDGFAFDALWGM